VFNSFLIPPARRSGSTSLAGSVVIHVAVVLLLLQVRTTVEAYLPRYTVTPLYVPTAEPVAPTEPILKKAPPLYIPAPGRHALILPSPAPSRAPDVPSLLPLPGAHAPSLPLERPPLPPVVPLAPPPPVFASASAVAASVPKTAGPRTGAFASVPVSAPALAAKPQVTGDAFGAVPAVAHPNGGAHGRMSTAGFGTAAVSSPNQSRAGSAPATTGFSAVATAATIRESAAQPSATGNAFGSAVAASPTRQTAVEHKPVAEALEILFKPRPAYTEEARGARIEGDVVLEVLFAGSGKIKVLRVIHGLGYGLEQTAINAAEAIRFHPARQDGGAVDTVATVRITFQMAY
jgi:TonB family protein